MEIGIARFVSHFPLSRVVFIWILPPHHIPKHKVIGRYTFRLIEKNPAALTTFDNWSNSYICRWVRVHFLLLYVFVHSAFLSYSYFFFTRRFCRCCAHVLPILATSFPCRHNSVFRYSWFRTWWNNIVRFVSGVTVSYRMRLIIFIIV